MGTSKQRVVLVAAVADNGVIGVDGRLPWRLPEDLAHFKRVTTGHVVLMGRRTFESIGRPLPRRTNIVVTRQPQWGAEGVLVASSIEEALDLAAAHEGDVMVIGGGEVYAATLPVAHVQLLTEVHAAPEGDAFYPTFDRSAWRETDRESHDGGAGSGDAVAFDIVRYERREAPPSA